MSKVDPLWPALMIASAAFQSVASILKVQLQSHFYFTLFFMFAVIREKLTFGVIQEFVFIDGAKRLKVSTSCIFLEKTMNSICILNRSEGVV